ncbi:MAG: sigma-70 family RNA polymerase sigma factor [Bifidobacteriaceae bacterium]|nr:sigma-70 family RNA polymerase sigma factor [Bifidobacteriaceae bacterium]
MTQPGAANDYELVEQLFARHADTVFRYCRLRLEAADAHDAVSEVFVVALRRAGEIPQAQLAWLLGVARRVVANQLRGRQRFWALAEKLGFEAARTQPDVAESVMATDVAYRALTVLRPPDREVLLLALASPLSQADLGLALGCSAKAAGVRLSRARARLEAAVAELDEPGLPAPAARANPVRSTPRPRPAASGVATARVPAASGLGASQIRSTR